MAPKAIQVSVNGNGQATTQTGQCRFGQIFRRRVRICSVPMLGLLILVMVFMAIKKGEVRLLDHQPEVLHKKEIGQDPQPTYKTTTFKINIDSSRQSVFQRIYKNKAWGDFGGGSGPGSTLAYTVILRKRLQEFVSRHNLSSMADIPCGAMEWTEVFLKSVWQEKPFFKYIGMDIAQSVVKKLQDKWKGNDRITIKLADLASNLPNITADFVFTRDALMHMPLKDACSAINNLINLGDRVKYVLIGTFPQNAINRNIGTGDYYPINLIRTPFNLPEPYLKFKEIADTVQKYVYVFKMTDLQKYKCQICTAYVKRNKCPK